MMKKSLLTVAAILTLFSVSNAQQNSALGQLPLSYTDISVPAVPPPSRSVGSVIHSIANNWDPSAPFSYNQNPAQLVPGFGVTLKNVRWGRTPADHKSFSWETVSINPALIEKVIFGYKTYGTGHSLLIFIFREGGVINSRGETTKALTFGAEAWSRAPYGYTLFHAMNGRYPLIWGVTTFESFADYVITVNKQNLYLKNMNLDRAQAARLFELQLARVDETNRNKEIYNLFNNSCTNNPVNLINQVVPPAQRISLTMVGNIVNPNASLPVLAVRKYTKNGLLQSATYHLGTDNYATFDLLKI